MLLTLLGKLRSEPMLTEDWLAGTPKQSDQSWELCKIIFQKKRVPGNSLLPLQLEIPRVVGERDFSF